MSVKEPSSVEELTNEYLSLVAQQLLRDPSVEVRSFQVVPEPFEFPRFGEKQFFEIAFRYRAGGREGKSTVVLRVLPRMDAVMILTGDTEHRELKAFETGLYDRMPKTFHIPYVHVLHRPERDQYWAFLEDVRPDMQELGMHAALPDAVMRTILSHLAAFHAAFWEDYDLLDQPWLMSLRRPVDYFYRCVVDILDGIRDPADSTLYVLDKWPWLAEGVVNLMNALEPETRRVVERLYREPDRLLDKVEGIPLTLCHYDFDNRNLGIRRGPQGTQTVVIDWEILGAGMSCADVVRFLVYQSPPNADDLRDYYLDELERHLGRRIDRQQWRFASQLQTVAEWQIRGVLFGVMVSAPSAPVPDDQRAAMKERVFADIGQVVDAARKAGLA